ncbi:hypothetical protein [Winogradskyella bathintestinalis]|uniref:Uncharacterized protein n=1 Tax=Winogradskyella bathintestinalis TaxID=3035208 RepID=A0ABT7ZRA3_9FLAO|nr:hypothetical protein [Winogradskyella bathintestinalis]MDN3491538.1 hypothetical protein [Winogradskyella bathintestinalis]
MQPKKILIIIGVILLIVIGFFYAYMHALGSAWVTNKPDKRPFYVTTKPVTIKNITLPEGTKIIYEKQYFWEKYEQEKLLNEEDITIVNFKEGTTINWGGVPITSIVKFFNSDMKGFSVYADFNKINNHKKSQFSNLWLSCNSELGITVENIEDWSFNKDNILDIESCGVNNQRYFKDDSKQQKFLDELFSELMKIKD